ncbi:aspartate aminotransferase [Bacilli bacterium PM5-3]|nr:aspartate aminotransferase [Bacilli bacterium PM5-3]
MSLELSKKVLKISPSATIGMVGKISQLRSEGKDIISFNIGEPDFNTASHINKAMYDAVESGHTKYVSVSGITELKKAICNKLKTDNNLNYSESQIVVSTGAKHSIYNTVMALVNEGDEVIIPTPCWVSYEEIVKLSDAKCVFVPTNKDNFQLDINAIKNSITDKTKAIIINTPNNPTGCVYSEEILKELGKLACEHDFYIISDEIYEKLIYDNKKHLSIASLNEEVYNRTITINGFAKAYAMTGHRIGYAAYPNDEIAKLASNLQAHTTSNSTSFVQYAALVALEHDQQFVKDMVEEFDRRRKLSFELLDEIPNIKYNKVNGAFYIMIDVSYFINKSYNDVTIKDADDLSLYLLDEALVALVPGKSFQAPNFLRFSYSNSQENISTGLKRMKDALEKLK